MTIAPLPHLFSPLQIGPVTVKNRIFSTGHQTVMNADGLPTDRMIAYQAAKAKGGAALIITESSRPHASALQQGYFMDVTDDRCIAPLRRMADAIHEHGAKVFGQLGHSGSLAVRKIDGVRREVYSASVMFDQRYKNVARPLSIPMIEDIIEGYRLAALRYVAAGYDGIEVMASHGVLPAQFLNPNLNTRTDEYGGTAENRMRFLIKIMTTVRSSVPADIALGIRLSLDEREELGGLTPEDTLPLCDHLHEHNLTDYFNVTGGTMISHASAVNVVPPMGYDAGYLKGDAESLKSRVTKPVFYAGRINQPQLAEDLLASGALDMCGMTRAIIADPNMANKASKGQFDDIVACIACNQACIGHLHMAVPISCIQSPETGRELEALSAKTPDKEKTVWVIGGGPAGMKAAVTAARRGHKVSLHEASAQLGGAARLAQLLPGREEFGGLITNLEHQLVKTGVQTYLRSKVFKEQIMEHGPDAVVLATGSTPHLPDPSRFEDAHVVHAHKVLTNEVNVGSRVVVYDWRGDWTALGLTEKLAQEGHHVRLVSEDHAVGMSMPQYVRDVALGRCHKLGIELIPNCRLFGAQDDSVFLAHSLSEEPVILENVDTLVLSTGAEPDMTLETALGNMDAEIHIIGDCLSPDLQKRQSTKGGKPEKRYKPAGGKIAFRLEPEAFGAHLRGFVAKI